MKRGFYTDITWSREPSQGPVRHEMYATDRELVREVGEWADIRDLMGLLRGGLTS
jgi:hypothetical protein